MPRGVGVYVCVCVFCQRHIYTLGPSESTVDVCVCVYLLYLIEKNSHVPERNVSLTR